MVSYIDKKMLITDMLYKIWIPNLWDKKNKNRASYTQVITVCKKNFVAENLLYS